MEVVSNNMVSAGRSRGRKKARSAPYPSRTHPAKSPAPVQPHGNKSSRVSENSSGSNAASENAESTITTWPSIPLGLVPPVGESENAEEYTAKFRTHLERRGDHLLRLALKWQEYNKEAEDALNSWRNVRQEIDQLEALDVPRLPVVLMEELVKGIKLETQEPKLDITGVPQDTKDIIR